MTAYGRAGRNAFRCGCGTRIQVTPAPVASRLCTFGDCRILATTKDPLRFCPDHEEQAAAMLAHTAGVVKVRELQAGLTQATSTWVRKYGYKTHPIPQNKQHAPLVYFARRERLIKIGTTTNLPNRMMALHAQALATEPGDLVRERQLHLRFRHLLASDQSREWFHPEPDLISYINELRAQSGILSVDSPILRIGECVELDQYLAETAEHHAPRTLTQEGEVLGGYMRLVKLARTHHRSQVHAAVTSTWTADGTAVAACIQSKVIGSGVTGLVKASTIAKADRCKRAPCRARWATLAR